MVVEKNNFAVIIAIKDEQIQLVTKYRHPVQERSLELPMAAWPEKPDADPSELALSDLQEEMGYKANRIEKIGFKYVDNGICVSEVQRIDLNLSPFYVLHKDIM